MAKIIGEFWFGGELTEIKEWSGLDVLDINVADSPSICMPFKTARALREKINQLELKERPQNRPEEGCGGELALYHLTKNKVTVDTYSDGCGICFDDLYLLISEKQAKELMAGLAEVLKVREG